MWSRTENEREPAERECDRRNSAEDLNLVGAEGEREADHAEVIVLENIVEDLRDGSLDLTLNLYQRIKYIIQI